MSAPAASLDLRSDFPILSGDIAYLDSAATSQKPESVIQAIDRHYRESNANIHRSVYELAVKATEAYEGARERAAEFVGWDTPTTIFTKNATEAINLVAYAWGRTNVGQGDVLLLTEMEHHSNIVPWQLLAKERGAELRYVPVTPDGKLDLSALDRQLARSPKLLCLSHVSNVLGTVNPVE